MPTPPPFLLHLALVVGIVVECRSASAVDPPKPADLLAVYKELGLPLPPAKAKLVRYEAREQPIIYSLAFELQPGTKEDGPLLLEGEREWRPRWVVKTEEVKPTAAAVEGVELDPDNALALAAQCHDRGWTELAKALIERSEPKEGHATALDRLTRMAWDYWNDRLSHPTADRKPVVERMEYLMKQNPEWDTGANRDLLKSLELALEPGKGKPGSVEALIDALVDFHAESNNYFPTEGAYWRVAVKGFDAIPALIAALDDERLTRWMRSVLNAAPRHVLVRHVAEQLLHQLSGGELDHTLTAETARAWWAKAEKIGEEKYLMDRVLPPAMKEWNRSWINDHLLRLIAAKYPKRLPEVYRTVLDKRPDVYLYALPVVVAKSSIPVKEKIDLFAAGGAHKDLTHRLWALEQLKGLDAKRFDALLLATIEGLPKDATGEYRRCPEAQFAPLAAESDDPKVWAALEAAIKRASFGLRLEMLHNLTSRDVKGRRTERLRLLVAYLDDTERRDTKDDEQFGGTGVGWPYNRLTADAVALYLAPMVGVELPFSPARTTDECAEVREKVRKAVKAELDKAK